MPDANARPLLAALGFHIVGQSSTGGRTGCSLGAADGAAVPKNLWKRLLATGASLSVWSI